MIKIIMISIIIFIVSTTAYSQECVVLLHGLLRSSNSMQKMKERLVNENYIVVNIDYPSRKHKIKQLAEIAVEDGIKKCRSSSCDKINFVTHSLGGILVRKYLKDNTVSELHRVVMLGPPNQGSEVVDTLKNVPGFEFINGPAGMQLGTKKSDLPKSLGPVDFEVGVIAGTKSINFILSTFLPNPNDGKVSVKGSKVEGMTDFVSIPTTHPFMMKNQEVINQVVYFLRNGTFKKIKP